MTPVQRKPENNLLDVFGRIDVSSSAVQGTFAGFSRTWELTMTIMICVAAGIGLCLIPMYAPVLVLGILAVVIVLKSPRYAILILLVFLLFQDPLQLLAGGDSDTAIYVKRIDELLIVGLGLYCLLASARVRHAFRRRRLNIAVGACYLGVIGSSMIAHPRVLPASVDLVLFSKSFLLVSIGCWIHPWIRANDKVFSRTVATLMLSLSSAIPFLFVPGLQERYFGMFRLPEVRLGFQVAQGFFINPSTFAWVASVTLCISYAVFLVYGRWWYLASTIAAGLFVLASWRRKSIAAVCIVLAVSLLFRSSMNARRRAALLVCVVALVSFTFLKPEIMAIGELTLGEYGHSDPLSTARSALYYTSISIARDHFPGGTGLASFGSYASRLYYSDTYYDYLISRVNGVSPTSPEYITDTFWPMVLGEGGVIACAGYIAFLVILGLQALSCLKNRGREPAAMCLALATLFLLAASLCESIASQIYSSSLQAAMVFIPAGVILGEASMEGTAGDVDGERSVRTLPNRQRPPR
jgi:hypothetical protein